MMLKRFFLRDKKGVAAVEAAMLFPIMVTLLVGMWDMGFGILANQNTVTASQVVGDLITRERRVDNGDIDNFAEAGRLVYGYEDTDTYGIDILSVRFGNNGTPITEWRQTRNMSPDPNALSKARGLGRQGEGVVVVTVRYIYKPTFAGVVTGDITMKEQSFLRGRRSPVVEWRS